MERHSGRSKEVEPVKLEWQHLLEEALTMPGGMSDTYSRFYNYSLLNQVLLFQQGVLEPVNTYQRWQDMGRQVQKGSKAKGILRPMLRKETDDQGVEEQKVRGFKMINCLFTVSDTEGDPLPEYEPKLWSPERAMATLAIREVAFDSLNGNTQGFSRGQELAINPVAKYPMKTLAHELGHIVIGHTSEGQHDDYLQHRGLKEFQAEGTAYLVMNEIEAHDQFDAAESRAYVQHWLRGEQPDDQSIRQVFTATDKIIKAGRQPEEVTNE
ncbi:antirestriction protein ArdC [Arthrobacter sp. UYCu511]|uniref:ArdC-like ssDNA-binding domain-containing protein n=1 Tax=Arthrobacter sp. UYCu511 TaxID=3156337 RepID=UPI00339752E9